MVQRLPHVLLYMQLLSRYKSNVSSSMQPSLISLPLKSLLYTYCFLSDIRICCVYPIIVLPVFKYYSGRLSAKFSFVPHLQCPEYSRCKVDDGQ